MTDWVAFYFYFIVKIVAYLHFPPSDPPTSPPVIQGYSNGDILYSGNSLVMTCAVQGGKPLVSSVVFSCPGHNDRSGDIFDLTQVQSVLTFDPLRVSDDGIYCVCTAVWMNTDWYTQSATRTLIVNGNYGNDDQ